MSYIVPNSTIKILNNIRINNGYEHTIYFATAQAQETYFSSKTKYTLTKYSFVRPNELRIRVELAIGNLYDCSYLMFQNTAFNNKWFYCFITKVEYINNNVTEITFEIDEIQTWLFDMTLLDCMVERNHIANDQIGKSLTPEPLEIGEYVFSDFEHLETSFRDYCVAIQVVDTGDSASYGSMYGRSFSGCKIWCCKLDDTGIQSIIAFLDTWKQKPDSVVNMYLVPAFIIPHITHDGAYLLSGYGGRRDNITKSAVGGTFEGYTPLNQKLYTYPYNFYQVSNGNGNEMNVRYEFFENNTPIFAIVGNVVPPVQAVCRPVKYKDIAMPLTNSTPNTTQQIMLTDFPLCSWANSAYSTWVAQHSMPLALQTTWQVSKGKVGAVENVLSEMYQASIMADNFRGTTNSGNVNIQAETQSFFGKRVHISKEYAQIVDDYFTKYGYAIGKIQTPNRNVRAIWTYIKTADCLIKGNCPSSSTRFVEKLYNRGITWWKDGDQVGRYDLASQNV